MDDFTCAGFDEETAAALTELSWQTGISAEALIAAMRDFAETCATTFDALQELGRMARRAEKAGSRPTKLRQRPPRSLGNMKSIARPPARPAHFQNQRGRKRR